MLNKLSQKRVKPLTLTQISESPPRRRGVQQTSNNCRIYHVMKACGPRIPVIIIDYNQMGTWPNWPARFVLNYSLNMGPSVEMQHSKLMYAAKSLSLAL